MYMLKGYFMAVRSAYSCYKTPGKQ